MKEFNFIHPDHDENDLKLFNGEEVITIRPEWNSLAHLVAHTGFFSSIKEAKKNGWDKPIPPGWNEFILGKNNPRRRIDLFVFVPFDIN